MDVDAPPRYTDSRVPYNRPFSPPSAADLARDRARAQFPPSPPRGSVASADPVPYDSGGRDWQYSQYNDRRREWSAAEEDSYWKARPQWDRNNPPSDRERFERDVPPLPPRNHGWDPRDDRDRRDTFTRPPSPRAFDGPPRPLSSRLTDNYSGPPPSSAPPVDRSYPPREPPPFNRVRQRSPSPVRRPGSPPPPSSGSSYYDRSGPPPSSAGTSVSVPGDRDYPGPPGRDNYPPPGAYDRPRSPGPPRDDRRYPPPSMAPPPPRRP
ncbi:hypothetical protein BDZ94DRAFT_1290359 [Collybia nuda]|uniref:Uncharacterized protein n=1 Tax=Collybia nuda TaxID=64659 RepID=A0A9P5Y626_9AGAR|nr:hypothetical protein BDZ94DRAFT_1290359 [Collybia nuda]